MMRAPRYGLSLIAVPLALGGEAVTETGGKGTLIAVISAVSIVVGYLLLYLLWRYVFSAKARDKRGEPPEY
jgi:heme/copper-type cytochrome/quinol oxidase subunit 2